jgi:hypothetical protein
VGDARNLSALVERVEVAHLISACDESRLLDARVAATHVADERRFAIETTSRLDESIRPTDAPSLCVPVDRENSSRSTG